VGLGWVCWGVQETDKEKKYENSSSNAATGLDRCSCLPPRLKLGGKTAAQPVETYITESSGKNDYIGGREKERKVRGSGELCAGMQR